MIVKLKDIYEIDNEEVFDVTNDLFKLLEMVDYLNDEQKDTTRKHALKLNEILMNAIETTNVIVLAISKSENKTVVYEMDYLNDGKIYGANNFLCEKNDEVVTHFELEVII